MIVCLQRELTAHAGRSDKLWEAARWRRETRPRVVAVKARILMDLLTVQREYQVLRIEYSRDTEDPSMGYRME